MGAPYMHWEPTDTGYTLGGYDGRAELVRTVGPRGASSWALHTDGRTWDLGRRASFTTAARAGRGCPMSAPVPWYRPGDPGAPQPGDLVAMLVVASVQRLCRLMGPWSPGSLWWRVVTRGGGGSGWSAQHIRRPTEAELAAWALDQPGGAP